MGKSKKRIIRKKIITKKIAKIPIKHKQESKGRSTEGQKNTPEQQARTNEMLKMMLSRPQQILPQGITSQNDELKQKLDSLTKRNVELAQTQNIMKAQINRQQELREQRRHEEEDNRRLQREIENTEAREDELANVRDRRHRLDLRHDALDSNTELGRLRQEGAELDTNIHNTEREIQQGEADIRNNTLYQEVRRKQADLASLTAVLNAQKEIRDSGDYKNPQEVLKRTMYELMVKQREKEDNDEVLKRQNEIRRMETEIHAHNQFIEDYNKKGDGGGPSKAELHTQKLAEQVKAQENAKMELDKLNLEMENNVENARKVAQSKIDLENKQREIDQMRQYVESEQYLNHLRAREGIKKEVELRERELQLKEDGLEALRKIKRIHVQDELNNKFHPLDIEMDKFQEEIRDKLNQVGEMAGIHTAEIQANRRLKLANNDMLAALDKNISRYEESYKRAANDNLISLIATKTGGKLPQDLNEYTDPYHLERATAFINWVGSRDPELLLNEEKIEQFIHEPAFADFEWKI